MNALKLDALDVGGHAGGKFDIESKWLGTGYFCRQKRDPDVSSPAKSLLREARQMLQDGSYGNEARLILTMMRQSGARSARQYLAVTPA